MKEDLKLATEPEHSYYEPVAYQVSEQFINVPRYEQTKAVRTDAGNYGIGEFL